MVAVASAEFWCCPGERNEPKKNVKKGAASMDSNSDFSKYTPAVGSKAIFAKPPSSRSMPKVLSTGDTITLASRNEVTPVETTNSYKEPSESIPKSGHRVSVPMSPPKIERYNRSPTRDTENIPTPGSNSVPIETRSRSPVPTVPMRSQISNPQVNEGNDKSIAPMPSYQRPSTELNNNGLSAGKANLRPAT